MPSNGSGRDWITCRGYESIEAQLELKAFNGPVTAQRLRRQAAI